MAFYPCGSWLENEQAKDTPAGFEYAIAPIPERHRRRTSCRYGAIQRGAGESYFVAGQGQEPARRHGVPAHMLSKEGAKGFTELTKMLDRRPGRGRGRRPLARPDQRASRARTPPGRTSSRCRFEAWYKKLDDEARTGDQRADVRPAPPDEFCERMQKGADAIKKDSSVKKFRARIE